MLYQFSAGICITSTDAYQTLDATQKEQARDELLGIIQAVADVMGDRDTHKPRQTLETLLADIPDSSWGVGADASMGEHYYFDLRTKSWVCCNDMALTSAGSDFSGTVTVAGVEIVADFYIRQSADN